MMKEERKGEGAGKRRSKRRTGRIVTGTLLALSLALSLGSAGYLIWEHAGEGAGGTQAGVKYTLYIGLNDKDAHEQTVSTRKARSSVDAICTRNGVGFTVLAAEGGWAGTGAASTVEKENTLVYLFYGASEGQVNQIADEAASTLNQASVLVERAETSYSYRSPEEEAAR